MPERLSALLHDTAVGVDVPPPAVDQVLRDGHARRRRRRVIGAAGAISVVAAVAAVAVMATQLISAHPRAVDPAAISDFQQWGAVAVGRDLYLGDTKLEWDDDITALYYTSQGVVVRSRGDYSLVRADGVVSAISVDIPDRVPGFEPDSTRFAYADALGGNRWELVVHDAATDKELARVEVDGPAYGGWEAPPAAIDGDRAWIHLRDHWVEVDWRTGSVRDVPGTSDTYEVANGSYAVQSRRHASGRTDAWEVRSWADGGLLGTADLRRGWYAFFSPDGRFLRAFDNEGPGDADPIVYDVASGASRQVDDDGEDFGWTPEGDLLVVAKDELRVCTPVTDVCRSRPFVRDIGDLRIGGNPYES